MKNNISIKNSLLLLFMILSYVAKSQLVVDNSPQTQSCTIGSFGSMTISVPTEALTGDNIPLNITLPGTMSSSCVKTITITTSDNLQFQTSGAIPFSATGQNQYTNTNPIAGNDGQNFNLFFKFPGYITCNGTEGTFTVSITVNCGGIEYKCSAVVKVRARAANYWSVVKQFVSGNLVCGNSHWRIYLNHNNPNGSGLGTYALQGTLTENAPVPVVSGAFFNINTINPSSNGSYGGYNVYLNNCVSEGQTITNNIDYNFILGRSSDVCGTLVGTATATSPTMTSPNASLSFTKIVYNSYNTNLTPGCQGRYLITLHNNGNVPWTNISVTDTLNIPGITLNGTPTVNAGWTINNNAGVYTFNGQNTVLNPGESVYIWVSFTVNNSANIGNEISNTAYVTYQADSGNGGGANGNNGSTACAGINCPVISTAIQNTSATAKFIVQEPRPIPAINKCILDAPNNLVPPIYQIGNTIKFALTVWNSGAGNLNTTINDALSANGQNLQIIPSTIQYEYYTNGNTGSISNCLSGGGQLQNNIPFGVLANTNDLHNPEFTISNMPGTCELFKGNYLRIIFEATILPQIYGSKTNRVYLSYNNSSLSAAVNYTVDQVGILNVQKRSDQQTVENGQSFNYIIDVANLGSVPLNNIQIEDLLPNCVQLNGSVLVRNGQGGAVNSSVNGNLQVIVSPNIAIAPGETFEITIPVRKTQSGNCCNITVKATAKMTTSSITLSANHGSESEPAACVSGTECCDVEGFSTQMVKRDGKYYIQVNGGALPLQEIDITMLDYHITYNQADCQPNNLGVFGQLTTENNQLGNLILQHAGPANSLTWGLGQPSVINDQIEIQITEPNSLDISCCEANFTFCLKVRVKDVNCNVCEKTICYTIEPEEKPCDLRIVRMNYTKEYCLGDNVTIAWENAPSGSVDIYLVDATNNTIYQTLATSVGGYQVYNFTISNNLPCDDSREWYILIKDSKEDCSIKSNPFKIKCCDNRCDCGRWKNHDVIVKNIITAVPHEQFENNLSLLKKASLINTSQKIGCGKTIKLSKGSYAFTAPDYICEPENCNVIYSWEIITPSGLTISFYGKTISQQLTENGHYTIKITPICGSNKCEPCIIKLQVGKVISGTIDDNIFSNFNIKY